VNFKGKYTFFFLDKAVMKRLTRYIFSQTFLMTLVLSGIFLVAVWLTQSLRFIDYVMSRGLPMALFFKLSGYLLPGLLSTILPITFLIAVLFIFSKLYADSELVVVRALGLSNLQIMIGPLLTACLSLSLLYSLNLYVQPNATKNFKDLKNEIRNNLTGRWIQPGTFNDFNHVTFYVKAKTTSGAMQGVFLYDARNPENPVTITAQLGQIIETAQGLRLLLFNGSRQGIERHTHKPTILNFDQYSLDVENAAPQNTRHRKANEMSMAELFQPDPDISERELNQRRIEAHERILLPLTVVPFALFAGLAFLLGDYSRRGRSKRVIQASLGCVGLEVTLLAFLNLSDKLPFFLPLSYALLGGLSLSAFFVLLAPGRLTRLWPRLNKEGNR
jgi:lipopolysaccharide export system permease protein